MTKSSKQTLVSGWGGFHTRKTNMVYPRNIEQIQNDLIFEVIGAQNALLVPISDQTYGYYWKIQLTSGGNFASPTKSLDDWTEIETQAFAVAGYSSPTKQYIALSKAN